MSAGRAAGWQPAQPQDLTRAQSNLLIELLHRLRQFPLSPCWLVGARAGRYAVLVPTGQRLERRFAVAGQTISDLHERGFITYGPDHPTPVYSPVVYLDESVACPVSLTEAGLQFVSAGRANS